MNLRNWMSEIDGNRDLLSLNIPGSHDAVTKYVWLSHISKTQDLNIYEQLSIGVRALDIRVEKSGNRLKMVHAIAKAFNTSNKLGKQMDMEDVLNHCYKFLQENPSETIVFQFKNDSNKENEKCFDNLYQTYILKNISKWYLRNDVPKLDDVRGKIYLIRRCKMRKCDEYTDENTGLDFSHWIEQVEKVPRPLLLKSGKGLNTIFYVQDRFNYKPVERWEKCIEPYLNKAKEFSGEYIIDYLSTAGGMKGPKRNAKYINARFMEKELIDGAYYGTIYCDFPSTELTEKIINLNF